MKPFFMLRIFVLLRRAVKALESIAQSQAAVAETVVAPTRPAKRAKLAEVFTPSIEQQNEAWQKSQDRAVYGEEIDDSDE